MFLFFLPVCNFLAVIQAEAATFLQLVADGNLAAVRREIARDPVLVEIPDDLGRSPLHLAVINGHLAIVNVLINAGANTNARDRVKHYTPLHYAAFHSFPKILQFLISRRADVHIADQNGNFPLHFAAANGCPATVDILLTHNANPDCMNKNWQTPLHLAARATANQKEFPAASQNESGYLEVARLLLRAGATNGINDIWQNRPETLAWQQSSRSDFPRRFSSLLRQFGRTR